MLLAALALLFPPTATLLRPELCDVGGSIGCSTADAALSLRALLTPAMAEITDQCVQAAESARQGRWRRRGAENRGNTRRGVRARCAPCQTATIQTVRPSTR